MRYLILASAVALSACGGAPAFKPADVILSHQNYNDDFYSRGAAASMPDTTHGMTIKPSDLTK